MKKYILAVLFIISTSYIFGQLDISAQYERPVFADWKNVVNDYYNDTNAFVDQSYYLGVGYRIYPFSYRVGFVPELGYSYGRSTHESNFNKGDYTITLINISIPVQFFPMDLYGDCNCPTFGKQNDFFQKALFFKIIPGASFQLLNLDKGDSQKDTNFAMSLGAGIGMNIALTNLVTIAPEISYTQIFSETWDGFGEIHDQSAATDHSSASKISAGIRVSLYFEE